MDDSIFRVVISEMLEKMKADGTLPDLLSPVASRQANADSKTPF